MLLRLLPTPERAQEKQAEKKKKKQEKEKKKKKKHKKRKDSHAGMQMCWNDVCIAAADVGRRSLYRYPCRSAVSIQMLE